MRSRASLQVVRRALLAGLGVAWVAALVVAMALALPACSPPDPAEQARSLHEQQRWSESIEPLRAALEQAPDDPELNHLYGIGLLRTGQRSLARWPLRRAMESPEWLSASALLLAASLLDQQNHEAAMEVLNELLAAEPENVDALLLRAQAKLISRRDYDGALADVERVQEIDPGSTRALVPRAAALLGLERLDEVSETLEELETHFRADELDPALAGRYCVTRATFAAEKGDLELAAERFEGCLADMPNDDGVIIAAIDFHDSQGHAARSLEIIRETLEHTPEATLYRTALAERLEQRGRADEAEALLVEGLEVGGAPDFVPLSNLSAHYQRQGRHGEAVDTFQKAVDSLPEPPPIMLFELAELQVLASRYDDALETAGRIGVPAMQELIRGRVHYERGEYPEALERFEAGLALWPDNAVARYLAARAAEQVGDFDRAVGEYRYAVRADAGATDARRRLVEIRVAEGDLAAARTEAIQATGRAPADPEAELAVLEAMAEVTHPGSHSPLLARLARNPAVAGRALAAVARGVARVEGPAAAADAIRNAQGLDLTEPVYAEPLDALVGYLIETGAGDEARDRVAAALAANPRSGRFRAIEAHRLERAGAPRGEVRAAWEAALALDPDEPHALAGLARLARAAGRTSEAADWYRKAADADPSDPELRRQAARLLLEAGENAAAREQLEALLAEHPTDAPAALRLGQLLVESGTRPDLERAVELAERARRFRGGANAEALLTTARARLEARS